MCMEELLKQRCWQSAANVCTHAVCLVRSFFLMHQSSVHKYEHLPFHVEIRWLNVKTLRSTAAQRLLQVSLQDLSTVVSPPFYSRSLLTAGYWSSCKWRALERLQKNSPCVRGWYPLSARRHSRYLGRWSHTRTAFDGDGCDGWTGATRKLEEPIDSNFPHSIRANGGSS